MGASIEIDRGQFETSFGRRPFRVGHRLVGHRLFELPRLLELATRLPPSRVEYNAGHAAIGQDPAATPHTGLSIVETIRRIEECGSWMVLKNVEHDAEYRALLDLCLDEVQECSDRIDPGMRQRVGYIFISSANAVTPLHIDPEYNFLLQIRGTKHVHMWDPMDRSVLPEPFLDRYFGTSEGHRNLVYRDEYAARSTVNQLSPGEGLHFPYLAPHWVKNGNAVSVSFSITFQTPRTEQRGLLHTINSRLRGFGIAPSPVGASPLKDAAKRLGYNVFQSTRRLVRGRRAAESTTPRY